MNLVVPERFAAGPAVLSLPSPMSGDDFYEFCAANPDVEMELTAKGEIIIVPPAGGESGYRTNQVNWRLGQWADGKTSGRAFGSSAGFVLPSGAILSPDAAWVSNERLADVPKAQRKKFLPVVPSFVIEVMSPRDTLMAAHAKMKCWIAEGIELGWLIDGDNETVYIFRSGSAEPECLLSPASIDGDGPVAGYHLPLNKIWAGL